MCTITMAGTLLQRIGRKAASPWSRLFGLFGDRQADSVCAVQS
ncbi:MAG: hypothetical protein RLZZ227_217 [Pseudomonadota bacterium]|jgi:hypothetical protein